MQIFLVLFDGLMLKTKDWEREGENMERERKNFFTLSSFEDFFAWFSLAFVFPVRGARGVLFDVGHTVAFLSEMKHLMSIMQYYSLPIYYYTVFPEKKVKRILHHYCFIPKKWFPLFFRMKKKMTRDIKTLLSPKVVTLRIFFSLSLILLMVLFLQVCCGVIWHKNLHTKD